jgi:hypothetical protein
MAGQGDRTVEELWETAAEGRACGKARSEEAGSEEGGSKNQDPPYVCKEGYAPTLATDVATDVATIFATITAVLTSIEAILDAIAPPAVVKAGLEEGGSKEAGSKKQDPAYTCQESYT